MSINPWVFHREKDIWGQDANEFKPERWLAEDAARLDKYFIPVSPPELESLSEFELTIDASLALDICLALASILLGWSCRRSARL